MSVKWELDLVSQEMKHFNFLQHLTLDVNAKCICEIHYLALDGFDLTTVHKLSSKEKKSWRSQVSNPGLLGGKQECFLCAMQPPHLKS